MEDKQCIADVIELHVRHALDQLKASEKNRNIAIELTKSIRGEFFVTGKNPRSIAGGIVYIAGLITNNKLFRTKNAWSHGTYTILDVCVAVDITEVSIRGSSKLLRKFIIESNLMETLHKIDAI